MTPDNLAILDKELRRDEGVRREFYLDSLGIKTVGVGHDCEANPLPIGWMPPLDDEQINMLLNHDLQVTFAALDLHIPYWKSLDDVRQRVLANMTFNMGIDRLLGFHRMLAATSNHDWEVAASEMLDSKWAKQVGDRAIRLSNMMKTGETA